ncbi:MAG: hypothetical protein RLY86_1314 [Pseudomonadota bacterium]|jgi:4-hydroxybenzoyl-CoA thioesterase
MEFQHRETVRFGQVDSAGIVFYPRYFEMISNTVEAWFEQALGRSWHQIHIVEGCGTPLLETHAKFVKASRLGDVLTFHLSVTDLSRATMDLSIRCTCGDEPRMTATVRHIYVRLDPLKSLSLPDDLRAAMERYRTAAG